MAKAGSAAQTICRLSRPVEYLAGRVVAEPDKTDLLNAYVAHSMNAWARATIDLTRQRKGDHRRKLRARMRVPKRAIARAG